MKSADPTAPLKHSEGLVIFLILLLDIFVYWNVLILLNRLIVFFASCAMDAQYLRKFGLCFVNAQYMHMIWARFSLQCARLYSFPQCARFAQHCTLSQCAIHAQDLYKIVLLSAMRNICPRFAQDCTSPPNALGPLTIYASSIIIQLVITFSIFLFKSTGQTLNNKEKKSN